ncbi:selenocysteine-specific translation elongation factor [Clostridium sp.]|uniref:selenocysteine-specific translation elongation factor n=1 Tax=Clostridium sp. TaxID=1506 RepID=UPI002FC88895
MKTIIFGTCGHIDHGKTSLIKALTGVDADRLEEEKKRGITIDLGYADIVLPSNKRISFIDVPGHEKFIKNMLAGITGARKVLFIVAADEGVMPQTVEHLEIINGLNIDGGIIALTKCDKCDEELISLAINDIRETFKGTALEHSKIIKTSVKTSEGLDELKSYFEEVLDNNDEYYNDDLFRMDIDRVFTINGAGTVVTGTIISGDVTEGDELILYPSKKKVKVRGIEAYGQKVIKVKCGKRCGLNISSVDKSEIKRGHTLSKDYKLEPSYIVDCSFKNTKKNYKIKHNERIRFYHGTNEIIGRVYKVDEDGHYIQIRLEKEIISKKGDKYYLRSYSPMYNIGGGNIINSNSSKLKGDLKEHLNKLELLEKGTLEEVIINTLKEKEFIYLSELDTLSKYGEIEVEYKLIELEESKKITIIKNCKENIIFLRSKLDIISKYLEDTVLKHHKKNALDIGMAIEELRKIILKRILTPKEFSSLLKIINSKDKFIISDGLISLKSFKNRLNLNQKNFKAELLKELEVGFISLNVKALSEKYKIGNTEYSKIINYLVLNKEILKLNDDVIIESKIFNAGLQKVETYLKEQGEITLGDCRDILNTNRKIALSFLEELDKRKITKRVENRRVRL